MTSSSEAVDSIQRLFISEWEDQTDYALDNESFDPPEVSDEARWVRLTILLEAGGQETLGAPGTRKFERVGRVIVSCFGPADKGLAGVQGIADAALLALEAKSYEGIHLFGGSARTVGSDGEWFQVNVEVLFRFYEQK